MFSLGIRAPINSGYKLFLDISFDFAIARNRMDAEPADYTTNFHGTALDWEYATIHFDLF